jgi:hypothetical protein
METVAQLQDPKNAANTALLLRNATHCLEVLAQTIGRISSASYGE